MSDSSGDPQSNPPRPSTGARASAAVPAPRPSAALRARGASTRALRSVGWRNRDVIRGALLVLAVFYGLQLVWVANRLFFVVFLGILFGIAVSGGVDRLERFKIPRGIAASLIVFTCVGLLFGFGAWMAPTLREQGAVLRIKLPQAVDRVEDWVNERRSGVLGLVLGESEPAPQTAPVTQPAARGRVQTPAPTDTSAKPSALQDQLKSSVRGLSRFLFPFITSTVEIVGGLILILFLSIYFAAEPDLYRAGLMSLLPAKKRARGRVMMDRVAEVLRKWLVTQLIAMVVMGVVNTIMLLAFGVKAAFALGILAGLFEFIPTIGPILSALPGIAMAFLDSPDKAIYVAFAYWFLQFLESHILIPLLMKQGIKLPPALTVITQTLLALVFGFLGLMCAVPILATVIVFVQMFYLERLPSEGTWTYPTFHTDLDEPLEAPKPAQP